MPGVINFEAGANFTFRLRKADVGEATRPWYNTYEGTAIASGDLSDLQATLGALLAFEMSLHYNVVTFQEGSISTWTPDSHPYNPDAFYTVAYNGYLGGKAPTGDVEPREVCWWVSRNPTTGNLGKLFYRRALTEGEVSSSSGAVQLTNPTGKGTELATAVTASGLSVYINGAATIQLTMVSRNILGYWIRPLIELASHGAAVVKFNHKWFNANRQKQTQGNQEEWSTEVHNVPFLNTPRFLEYEA